MWIRIAHRNSFGPFAACLNIKYIASSTGNEFFCLTCMNY